MAVLVGLLATGLGGCQPEQRQSPEATVAPAGEASSSQAANLPNEPPEETASKDGAGASLPRLVDLGAGKCIPCKMMAPILDELREEYQGQLEIVFIDVWENPSAGQEYGIRMIPTQIFFDAAGKERYRHEGFFSKQEILAKWRELGVDLDPKSVEAGQ